MKYDKYEQALSKPRLEKYKIACRGDKNKALVLYCYNIKLCQKFYGILSVLEVVLRNAIDKHNRTCLSDSDWLMTQATNGFLVNYQDSIFKERGKLVNNGNYTHDNLIASLSFGIWTFMFSRNCYKNSGKTLLQIFPNKTHGLNQREIYDDLDKIRLFRNRIAHHESLCFSRSGEIYTDYIQQVYDLIIRYIEFMGYRTDELFYGVETPISIIAKIKKLEVSI
jgi:hypothetical protein